MRRHHLIEESKSELDVAYEQVKAAEQKLMSLEFEYNERIKSIEQANGEASTESLAALTQEKESLQAQLDLETLYELQTVSVERFAAISTAFTIIGAVEDTDQVLDLIRNILFRPDEIRQKKPDIDKNIRKFAKALRAYSREDSNEENDTDVRESWTAIESLLRDFGRKL